MPPCVDLVMPESLGRQRPGSRLVRRVRRCAMASMFGRADGSGIALEESEVAGEGGGSLRQGGAPQHLAQPGVQRVRPRSGRRAELLRVVLTGAVAVWAASAAMPVRGELRPEQVLVIYNSQGPQTTSRGVSDSELVYQAYRRSRPGVLGFDLNDPTLLPGDISYDQFTEKIRDPIRQFLASQHLESQIVALTLTRGIPHRITDINRGMVGDDPSAASSLYDAHNITYASVDSELTLLWQDLEMGEANGPFDSHADQVVWNPYHGHGGSITVFDRSKITDARAFENFLGADAVWRMREEDVRGNISDPGTFYLTARLDGESVSDVQRMIDRARLPSFHRQTDALILDESPPGQLDNMSVFDGHDLGHLGDDYDQAGQKLKQIYPRTILDESETFLVGAGPGYTGTAPHETVEGNVAALVSYGGNHDRGPGSPSNNGYVASFAGQFVDGAVMNTMESYNARQFGGRPGFADQGQLAEFIAAGGTLGVGNVWEPFAFSIADSDVLLKNLLDGQLAWAEVAWSSIPWLSWQNLVIGDPLTRVEVIHDPQPSVWTPAAASSATDPAAWADSTYWTRGASVGTAPQPGDPVSFPASDAAQWIDVGGDRIVESLAFQGDYVLRDATLAIRSGSIEVAEGAAVEIHGLVLNGRGLEKVGQGHLRLVGRATSMTIREGTAQLEGVVQQLTVGESATLVLRGLLEVEDDLELATSARLAIGTAAEDDDRTMIVHGNVRLGGAVELPAALLEVPQGAERGDRWPLAAIVSDGELSGNFSEVLLGEAPAVSLPQEAYHAVHVSDGLFVSLFQGTHHLALELSLAAPGDVDGDLDIDSADLSQLLIRWTSASGGRFGRFWSDGDFDGDQDVDVADLNSLLQGWTGALEPTPLLLESIGLPGMGAEGNGLNGLLPNEIVAGSSAGHLHSASVAAVPEPAKPLWAAIIWASVTAARRRRKALRGIWA